MAGGAKFASIKRRKAVIPAMELPRQVMDDLGAIASAGIIGNIVGQRQADGQPIQRNSQSWRDHKIKMGWLAAGRVKSLIAEKHRFVKGKGGSWEWVITGTTLVVKPATRELANLSRWVQEKGYLGWFAISSKTAMALRSRVRRWMRGEFEWARGKARMDAEDAGTTADRPEWRLR